MALLSPTIRQRFFDQNGDPLVGGKLWTYTGGSSTPKISYSDQAATAANTNPIILDANGECDLWLGTGFYKIVLMDASDVVQWTVDMVSGQTDASGAGASSVPDGGAAGAVLAKLTSANQDTEWKQYGYSGYSARFSAIWNSTDLDDTLKKILNITYNAPLVSLSASGNVLREKGTIVASTTLMAAITKRSDPIAQVRFYKGATLLDTQTSGGGIPSGGSSTYGWTGSFSDNTTFSVQVDDNGATGGPTTVSSSTTFNFVYPYYVGSGAAGLSGAAIAGLTKLVISQNNNHTYTISVGSGQYTYYAYPASYGDLTSILDVNGFEVLPSWTKRTVSITGLDATSQSYTVYEGNNPLTAGSYQFTFKR